MRQPVDIVVLLLLPGAGDGPKGNALACVARALRDPETLWKLRSAPNRETLLVLLPPPTALEELSASGSSHQMPYPIHSPFRISESALAIGRT